MKLYRSRDADLRFLDGKRIAVLGYGSQGAAQALCFRDSGLDVIVSARKNGPSWRRASTDGFELAEFSEAARKCDIVCMLISDTSQPEIYYKFIHKHMKRGKTLYFSHGFNITYGFIKPPPSADVIMVAPHGPGKQLRDLYLEGKGLPALLAVNNDASGKAEKTALALAAACGFTRAGVFKAPFNNETYADLFSEQVVFVRYCTLLQCTPVHRSDVTPSSLKWVDCW